MMKRIILFLLVLATCFNELHAQQPAGVPQQIGSAYTYIKGYLRVKTLVVEGQDTINKPTYAALIFFNADSSWYTWDLKKFTKIGTGSGGGGGGTWGSITGTLSAQTDLQAALNAKQNTLPSGSTAQYFRGDKTLATFPDVPIKVDSTRFKDSIAAIRALIGSSGVSYTKAQTDSITAVLRAQGYTRDQVDSIITTLGFNIANSGTGVNVLFPSVAGDTTFARTFENSSTINVDTLATGEIVHSIPDTVFNKKVSVGVMKYGLSKLLSFGDSFTAGYGLSSTADGYVARLADMYGLSVQNYGANSCAWISTTYNLFANWETSKSGAMVTFMNGFNMFRNPDALNSGIYEKIQASIRASLAVIYNKEKYPIKTPGYAGVVKTGTWTDSYQSVNLPTQFPSYARQGLASMGQTTTIPGNKISYTTQFASRSVVVGFVRFYNEPGVFTVKVDGVLQRSVQISGIDNYTEFGSSLLGTVAQDAVIIKGLELGIHVVEVEFVSGSFLQLDWVGTLKDEMDATNTPVLLSLIPNQEASQYAPDGSSATEFKYGNNATALAATEFDGFPVRISNPSKYFKANVNDLQVDNIHPNVAGNSELLSAFVQALNFQEDIYGYVTNNIGLNDIELIQDRVIHGRGFGLTYANMSVFTVNAPIQISDAITLRKSTFNVPQMIFTTSAATTDNKKWDFYGDNTAFHMRAISDDEVTISEWLNAKRVGTTVTEVAFPSGRFGFGTNFPVSGMSINRSVSITKDSLPRVSGTNSFQLLVIDTLNSYLKRMKLDSLLSTIGGITDSTIYSTKGYRQKGDDSLGAIIATKAPLIPLPTTRIPFGSVAATSTSEAGFAYDSVQNKLFTDSLKATNIHIGGGNSPAALHVEQPGVTINIVSSTDNVGPYVNIKNKILPTTSDKDLGGIYWGSGGGADLTYYSAFIRSTSDAAWSAGSSYPGRLDFYTTASGATSSSLRMRIMPTGNVGYGGLTSASARVHIAAGSTTAGTAPLKLNAGTLMTTPENDAIEATADSLFSTKNGKRRAIVTTDYIVKTNLTGAVQGSQFYFNLSDSTIKILAPNANFVSVTGTSQTAAVNIRYQANNAALVTITLPTDANSAIGDQVIIRGYGAGGWKLAQPEASTKIVGTLTTTTGTGGSLNSANRYDCVTVEKQAANTWLIINIRGGVTTI